MAELMTAFKSKYSGEQIENLLDKLKDINGTPTGTVTTAYPYERTQQKYETDNIIITSNHIDKVGNYSGTGGKVEDIIYDDTSGVSSGNPYSGYEFYIAYEFKNNIKVKLKNAYIRAITSGNSGDTVYVKLYYIDTETQEEILFSTSSWGLDGKTKSFTINITDEIKTSKIVAKCLLKGTVQLLTYDFEIVSSDNYSTNSLENVSMQNEFTETEV